MVRHCRYEESNAFNQYSSVISIFLKQRLSNKSLTVVGDGLQTRSFIYVSDVVNAMIAVAKSKVSNEIFNVGSYKSTKIKKIAQLLSKKKFIFQKDQMIQNILPQI